MGSLPPVRPLVFALMLPVAFVVNSHSGPVSGMNPSRAFLTGDVEHSIPINDIHHGGPAVDGIPALNSPQFVLAQKADFLNSSDRVLGIELNGQAKAYPIRILNWHEIVNDELGGTPVTVSFCPLCGTGMVFDRRVEGQTLTFGVSGLLYNSDLLMYDLETQSLWSQVEGKSVVGPKNGTRLKWLASFQTSWKEWKEAYPDSPVLKIPKDFRRDYSRNPYRGYKNHNRLYFPVSHHDKRLSRKTFVFGIRINDNAKAYPLGILKEKRIIRDKLAGTSVTLQMKNGSPWAETKDGLPIPGTTAFWFAWAAFYPDTLLYAP